jgi:hypothetical protein
LLLLFDANVHSKKGILNKSAEYLYRGRITMVYLIIAFAILLIAAPIMAVLPSKRDKERMKKRQTAMRAGISVEMAIIDDPDPDPQKYLSTTGKPIPRRLSVAAYRIQRIKPKDRTTGEPPAWVALRYKYRHRTKLSRHWYWEGAAPGPEISPISEFLVGQLDRLPADAVKVEEKNYFISSYWHEDGEVQEVIDFLKRCATVGPGEAGTEPKLLDGPGQ